MLVLRDALVKLDAAPHSGIAGCLHQAPGVAQFIVRFGSIARVLAKRVLKYYRIS